MTPAREDELVISHRDGSRHFASRYERQADYVPRHRAMGEIVIGDRVIRSIVNADGDDGGDATHF